MFRAVRIARTLKLLALWAGLVSAAAILVPVHDRAVKAIVGAVFSLIGAALPLALKPAADKVYARAQQDDELLKMAVGFAKGTNRKISRCIIVPGPVRVPVLCDQQLEITEGVYKLPEAEKRYAVARAVGAASPKQSALEVCAYACILLGLSVSVWCDFDARTWVGGACAFLLDAVGRDSGCKARA